MYWLESVSIVMETTMMWWCRLLQSRLSTNDNKNDLNIIWQFITTAANYNSIQSPQRIPTI